MTKDVENLTFAYLYFDNENKPVFSLTTNETLKDNYTGMIYYSKAEAIFYPD